MEKLNDTMTIYTLAKQDTVTIRLTEYRDLMRAQGQYERIIELLLQAISLDYNQKADIDYKGKDRILMGLEFLEPDAFNYRIRRLKGEDKDDGMD